MTEHVARTYQFNLGLVRRLVGDLTPDQMALQPGGVINHPAWTLGHLVMTADSLAAFLGLESQAPDGWDKTFATGGTPSGDPSVYPSKDELLDALTVQHERVAEAVRAADPASFARPHPNEKLRQHFPTAGDMVVFVMTSHEMNHVGQIAAWRRAAGLGPAPRG